MPSRSTVHPFKHRGLLPHRLQATSSQAVESSLSSAPGPLAICWLLFARVKLQPSHASTNAPWRNVMEGFKYVRGDVLLLSMVPLYLIPMLTQNTTFNFLPIFARDILKIGASGYGFLQAAPGLGALASLIGLAALPFYRLNGSFLFVTAEFWALPSFSSPLLIWQVFPYFLWSLSEGGRPPS
jgi:hypothetical protein